MGFPFSGKASTYADHLDGHRTASGERYRAEGFTAALLPRSNWHAFPLGTLVKITHGAKSVVIRINDRGDGYVRDGADPHRVLDLSHAAMAALLGMSPGRIDDHNAGVIDLDQIEVVPHDTPLGALQETSS